MKNNDGHVLQKYLTMILLICCGCLFVSCTPLRKKFIREKKKDAEDSRNLPILDPVTYPPPSVSAQKQYSYHYSLWKVWGREFEQTVQKDGSEKRQQYLVGEMIKQIEEMKAWVTGDQHASLDGMITQLKNISTEIENFSHKHNNVSFEKKVQRFNRDFSRSYKPARMESHFVK